MLSRKIPIAVLIGASALSASCAKSKKKDAPQSAPVTQPVNDAAESAPASLIGRMALSDLTQSPQVTAEFSSSNQYPSSITTGSIASAAFSNGRKLKFSSSNSNSLEDTMALGGGYYGGGYYSHTSYGRGYGGWNFPILNGVLGFISNIGSLVFGGNYNYNSYGYGYSSYGYGGYGSCGCQSGYGSIPGYEGYYNYDRNNPPFPFGPSTQYDNPNYVWTPSGPVYNNPTLNPFPTTGITVGTRYNTGIPGCTPSIYDKDRGWIASTTPVNDSAPLCNGQTTSTTIGPVPGTTYTTGVAGCVPATFDGTKWKPTSSTSNSTAPLCDGNVYSNVTSIGTALDSQMPSFAPVYTSDSQSYNYNYVNSYDDSTYRYYVYGR